MGTSSPHQLATLHPSTPGETIAEHIDRLEGRSLEELSALVSLLSERNPIYRNRSTNEIFRIRGYVMASLERTGLPDGALPYVLGELESTFHPYMVAAAARALRGMKPPSPQVAPYLIKAIYNVWQGDKPVSFAAYHVEWPAKDYTTALTEIFETFTYLGSAARDTLPDLKHLRQFFAAYLAEDTLAHLGEAVAAIEGDERDLQGSCCEAPTFPTETGECDDDRAPTQVPRHVVLEDQNGIRLRWEDFFCQRPTVLGFFYTRCGNPRKCTQTILNLAALQAELDRCGLKGEICVAAITYDPQFDTPETLRAYGEARGYLFDNDFRMFRVPEEFHQVAEAFQLSVSYTGSQVSSHRIELYLLDRDGNVARSFLRLQSEPQQVLEALTALLEAEPGYRGAAPGSNQPATKEPATACCSSRPPR